MNDRTVVLAAGPEHAGMRADVFIARAADGISRNAAQRLLEQGRALTDGRPLKKNDAVAPGQVVILSLELKQGDILPQDIPLDIVYEDSDVIVINKPKGLVVHPAPGHEDGTLVNALMRHCGQSLSGINGEIRPGIVHRIDKDTSGLIVCAKNDAAHRSLVEQIAAHTAGREYDAVVRGVMKEDSGTVDAPIGRSERDRKKMAVNPKNGRPARTDWTVVERFRNHTYVRCSLHTGRTHQIRVHMASIGRPVLGDTVYGYPKPELGQDSQCLHARRLRFVHPATGQEMYFETGLPDYFSDVLTKLRKMG